MTAPRIIPHATPAAMADALADSIAATLNAAPGPVRLTLPGGRSPVALITALAARPLPWDRLTFSTTDERVVPDDSPDNNATQIARLLAPREIALLRLSQGIEKPWHSTVTVLGMGMDGHIASLFPAMTPDDDNEGPVIPATAPAEPRARLSLTMAALMSTNRLILLVPDREKWLLCRQLLDDLDSPLPLARLMRRAGEKLELHAADFI